MKPKLFILSVAFLSILFSCSNSDEISQNTIDESDLIGIWDLTNVEINNNTPDDVTTDHTLSFQNKEDYYRTYVTGTWKLKNNIIELDAITDSYDWNIEIIEISSNILKVKMELTEIEYGWDFNEFSANEVLTIFETYERLE